MTLPQNNPKSFCYNPNSVKGYGRKKDSTATAHCTRGTGLIEVNGRPLAVVKSDTFRRKIEIPILLVGKERFKGVDIKIEVRGGHRHSQVYAIQQALAEGLVESHRKFVDEASTKEIRRVLIRYDRSLLIGPHRWT